MEMTEYTDELVHIDPNRVIVRNFYPNGSDRPIDVPDIEWVLMRRSTVWNGKLRFWGTGAFHTWFATDVSRPTRDAVFTVKLRNKWWRIGFTVEDSQRAAQVLRQLKLLRA